jgi:homocysteine S-methyltransferase
MRKRNILEAFWNKQSCIVLDGAMATELERRGADLQDRLWSARLLIENPDLIRQVHWDYFLAGADVAITASYQATFEGFSQRGLTFSQSSEVMKLSVRLAQQARHEFWNDERRRAGRIRPLVAASIGPYGAFLADGSEYRGDYRLTTEQLMDFHRPRLAILATSGADLLACETIPCLDEAHALLRVLSEFPEARAWLSFSCCDSEHLSSGEKFADAVALAHDSPQIVAIGVNCTPPRFIEDLLLIGRRITDTPLLCYPNSGETWDALHHCWLLGEGGGDFSEPARRWFDAGARLIGGCCRTTPQDIAAIRRAVVENAR